MNREKQIEELVKVVRKLTFDLRTNMTSVTRYVKHERAKAPNLTEGQFIDRHLEYRDLALEAVDNILKCINENEQLTEIENMRFESKGDRFASVDALEVFDEILERARKKRLFVGNGMFTIRVVRIEDIEQILAELKKKYEVDV